MKAFLLLLLVYVVALPSLAQQPADAMSKPVKALVQAIRYGRDEQALAYFAGEEQGRFLLQNFWSSGTDAQRKTFTRLFQSLFRKIAFPRMRESWKNLSSVTYENPQPQGDRASLSSTILIDHPVKKQEIKLKYSLVKDSQGWKVLDVAVLGDSMLAGIRDDQVQPLLKDGGWQNLLATLQKKDAGLK